MCFWNTRALRWYRKNTSLIFLWKMVPGGGLWLRQQAPCSSNRADLFCNFNMAYTPCHRQSGIKTTTIITTDPAGFKQAWTRVWPELKRPQSHRESELIAEWGVGGWSLPPLPSIQVHINPTPGPSQSLSGVIYGWGICQHPTGGIVHKPDLKSGIETCQMDKRAVLIEFDGFEFDGGCFGYARVEKYG